MPKKKKVTIYDIASAPYLFIASAGRALRNGLVVSKQLKKEIFYLDRQCVAHQRSVRYSEKWLLPNNSYKKSRLKITVNK